MKGATRKFLARKIEDFCRGAGLSPSQLSLRVFNNPNWVNRLKRGDGVSLTSIEKVEEFIDAWPGEGQPGPYRETRSPSPFPVGNAPGGTATARGTQEHRPDFQLLQITQQLTPD